MTEHIGDYRACLQARGPAGLDYLNGRVPHRYTAIYELAGGTLRNLYLYDKRGEVVPEFLQAVPFQDSFCQFVLRDGVFATSHSGGDQRLDGHKYQGVMMAYHGVPLLDNRGELFGTLCHFDVVSHGLPEGELDFMQRAARELPRYLPRR
ncbi:GAF domain-containing protein [Pseudorhodoferax sp. Leaf274]|uniref:GAF domain-containing protein n=1 Tax=Pseudorhodoferax sp. Leaf274 TaxID=1736318 RepID=UPI0012E1AAB3|nr:GAF domain-containing protein [Pseudorhodoferax sp. Leaf274]